MRDILDKLKQINEGHLGMMADRVELDHEVQMARADLYKIAKYAIKLHDMMKNVSEVQGIEGWQQSKITKAADYLGSVYHNLDYEMSPMNPMNDEGQMDQMAFDLATEDKIIEKEGYTDKQRSAMDKAVAAANDPASGERTTGNPADGVGAAAAKANAGAAAAATDPASGERTTGNPADGIGAAAKAANRKAMGKTNESKFSDWGKK